MCQTAGVQDSSIPPHPEPQPHNLALSMRLQKDYPAALQTPTEWVRKLYCLCWGEKESRGRLFSRCRWKVCIYLFFHIEWRMKISKGFLYGVNKNLLFVWWGIETGHWFLGAKVKIRLLMCCSQKVEHKSREAEREVWPTSHARTAGST